MRGGHPPTSCNDLLEVGMLVFVVEEEGRVGMPVFVVEEEWAPSNKS